VDELYGVKGENVM